MLPALLLMAALTPAAATPASPADVGACVALRALPSQSLDLLAARHTEEGLAALMALAQTGGVAVEDQAWWREQLTEAGEAGEVDGDRLRHWAEQGFERCAARLAPHSPPEQRALCGADLDTLPVILLYRVDGVALPDARRDLSEGTAALADGVEQGRAQAMLRFSYEGAAPRREAASRWMRERQERWVARCLQARGAGARP
ncbi:hypothetical protein H5407_10615 [Mitsuaria sp. WAJ17]|uniref:hypothetical protein n=1 Tax=Mitsuaria sp. WAJ17 TaxID=2761452 RepID=UPI0015FFFAFC|nr:hypothetical protein [Mitsuaria sp. WAJ17]MBB2485670.1 hypothetical protein [Mitsuaria sp. WAJ17]